MTFASRPSMLLSVLFVLAIVPLPKASAQHRQYARLHLGHAPVRAASAISRQHLPPEASRSQPQPQPEPQSQPQAKPLRAEDFDFTSPPKRSYLERSGELFRQYCGLHPQAQTLDLRDIQMKCQHRKLPDICLVTELESRREALVASHYAPAEVARMQRLPEVVEQSLLVPEGFEAKSHHASTIAEVSPGEFLVSWFGGSWEAADDTSIYLSRLKDGQWSEPWAVVSHETSAPLWNPVLLHIPTSGETLLFYKEGADPLLWFGKVIRSADLGHTWSTPEVLPEGILGPSKNKPIVLADGTIVSPSSEELGEAEQHEVADNISWFVHMEKSKDGGRTWQRTAPVQFAGNIIQPSLYVDSAGKVRMLARMTSNTVKHADFDEHWHYPRMFQYNNSMVVLGVGDDSGTSFHDVRRTSLPCPNSGLDAVRLRDGRLLLAYNPTKYNYRAVLGLAMSEDDGETWYNVMDLERFTKADLVKKIWTRFPEYSYPAIIQAEDGLVHVTYTMSFNPLKRHKCGRENIKHVVVNPLKLQPIKLQQEEINAKKLTEFAKFMTTSENYMPNSYRYWINGNNGIRSHITFEQSSSDGDTEGELMAEEKPLAVADYSVDGL